MVLQEAAAEAYLVAVLKEANGLAIHATRVTILPKGIELAKERLAHEEKN